jgi:hypothetical protein
MRTKTKRNPNLLPEGLIRFAITLISDPSTSFPMVAKTRRAAWNKFVVQKYSQSPLKPDRKDWTVKEHPNQNLKLA